MLAQTVVALAMAGTLLWAALEKSRDVSGISAVLQQLGIPAHFGLPAAALLMVLEIAVAIGLMYDLTSAWTHAGVLMLAISFATAGMKAIRSGQTIRCNCFGTNKAATLGMRQIGAFPVWVAGIAVLRTRTDHVPTIAGFALNLAVVGLALAALRAISLWDAHRQAKGDRRSARETYAWLN